MKKIKLINVSHLDPSIEVDLAYASEDNFLKRRVYPKCSQALLQVEVAHQLVNAQKLLRFLNPELNLCVKDAYRPYSCQVAFWEVVQGTSMEPYVANPYSEYSSNHNYGVAVDVILRDLNGNDLDMGTPFDHFGDLAEPRLEFQHVLQGRLSQTQFKNRMLLRQAMEVGGGFQVRFNEWWHFDAMPAHQAAEIYAKGTAPTCLEEHEHD